MLCRQSGVSVMNRVERAGEKPPGEYFFGWPPAKALGHGGPFEDRRIGPVVIGACKRSGEMGFKRKNARLAFRPRARCGRFLRAQSAASRAKRAHPEVERKTRSKQETIRHCANRESLMSCRERFYTACK